MKPVLILQHQTAEPPGYLAAWLVEHSIAFAVFDAEQGNGFPNSMEPYSALAVLGGSMSANDNLASNRQAEVLILQAMLHRKPVIGHCLGGQLMTRAMGGTVNRAAIPEIGWQPITYIDSELTDQWFGSDPAFVVAQWHYDTFSVPPGATLLALSPVCATQAWAWGLHLAMQFHIEMDASKTQSWAKDPDPDWAWAAANFESVQHSEAILAGVQQHLPQHQRMANQIYTRWLSTTPWAVIDKF